MDYQTQIKYPSLSQYLLIDGEKTDGSIPLWKTLAQNEKQSISSRI